MRVCVCVSVCFCLSVSVGTMALLRRWESQAPRCLARWTGVSGGTFVRIGWPLCPFQARLLRSGESNMNLEAIKDGWLSCCHCPLPSPPFSLSSFHTNRKGMWVLSINRAGQVKPRSITGMQFFYTLYIVFLPTNRRFKLKKKKKVCEGFEALTLLCRFLCRYIFHRWGKHFPNFTWRTFNRPIPEACDSVAALFMLLKIKCHIFTVLSY